MSYDTVLLAQHKKGALQILNHAGGVFGCISVNVSAPFVRQTGTC